MQTDTKVSGTKGISGSKYDKAKPRMDLLDMDALEGLAAVLSFGAEKYEPYNWRLGIVNSRLIASMLRHLSAIQRGEDVDPESGLLHIDHLGCNWMFLSYNYKRRPDLDDRPRLHQPTNQSECIKHSDNTLLETINAIPDRQPKSCIDWTASQLANNTTGAAQMGQGVAKASVPSYNLGIVSGANLEHQSNGWSNELHGNRNGADEGNIDGYYSTPFGYLNADIAKAILAQQKELDV